MKKNIVIEGIHGSGKTSVAKTLAEKLQQKWIQSQYYHFPDEADQLGQVIRSTLTDKDIVKHWQVTGLLYAAFSNRFHIKTKSDRVTYVQDRDSLSSGLVFQSSIPRDSRLAIYQQAIENLQHQGIVVYVRSNMEIARQRLDARNLHLLWKGWVWEHKAKDVFIKEDFENLSLRYEREMLPWLERMWIPYIVVENNWTLEECIDEILKKLK